MTATVQIDDLGRLVIPEQTRATLRLKPGDQLEVQQGEEGLVLQPMRVAPGLVEENGLLVFDAGGGPDTTDIPALIHEMRERRMEYIAGLRDEP